MVGTSGLSSRVKRDSNYGVEPNIDSKGKTEIITQDLITGEKHLSMVGLYKQSRSSK